jgi:hypothetical protein
MVSDHPEDIAEYWRARAAALEDELDSLKELVWALAESLPAETAASLVWGLSRGVQILPSGKADAAPGSSDIRIELERIWKSLAARRRN